VPPRPYAVFDILAAFAAGQLAAGHWVGEIESIAP